MIWFASAFIVVTALALFFARAPAAKWQGLIMGGTMPPGCVVAEVVALVLFALLIVALRSTL